MGSETGLNRVQVLGRLGADPELKMTGGGKAVLKLRVAVTESYLDRNNARQEKTEWVPCTLWGKRAESLSKILAKGDNVYIEGGFSTSTSERDGQKRYFTEVNVSEVILCGGKRGGGLSGSSADTSFDYGANVDEEDPFAQ